MKTCPSDEAVMTLGRLLEAGAAYLRKYGIAPEEALSQTEILLSQVMGFQGPRLYLERDRVVPDACVEKLRTQFLRLSKGEPLQYILGEWPFHQIHLKTDARALIPRPETEQLVERVLQSPQWKTATSVADIGTGTGAIILSLAFAREQIAPGQTAFTAIDLSPEALSLAKENAQALHLDHRIDFRLANGASTLPQRSCDIIVSNPPYISTAETNALPSLILAHEPRMALDGGEDGLDILRQIVLDATLVLRPGGRLFLEIGDEQGLSMRRILDRAGYTDVVIAKDFAGHDRYAEGSLP